MSITRGAVVIRTVGDIEMAAAMADSLAIRDSNNMRSKMQRISNELDAHRSARARDDERRLEAIRRKVKRPLTLWERLSRWGAFHATLLVFAWEWIRYGY